MIFYIAGPITGKPDHNRLAFSIAEKYLSGMGHTVLNPAKLIPIVNPDEIDHDQYMAICYAMMDAVQALYFLDGWQDSKGARIEHVYGEISHKLMFYETPPGLG